MEQKKYFGVMLNVSRANALKIEKLKEFALTIKKMGYNMIEFYCEDSFEVSNEPYWGYLRGGYSKDEIKEFVKYCDSIDVEVIPCIETLAHLEHIYKWKEYAQINDVDNVLLVDDARTEKLLDNIFQTLRECFTSNLVNIGLDEAIHLGLGAYLKIHGYTEKKEIFLHHLNLLKKLADKYGYKVHMWSDMLYTVKDNGYFNYKEENIDTLTNIVPEDFDLVYWEYFYYNKDQYIKLFESHKKFNREIWFAGAVHNYIGFTPINEMSQKALVAGLDACKDEGINNIIITLWGGEECSHFSTLASLCFARCYYEGITDINIIKKRFKEATNQNYDLFLSLDSASTLPMNFLELPEVSFSKFVIYQDVFNGFFDPLLKVGSCKKYLKKANEFEEISKVNKEYGYLFYFQSKVLKLMYYKHDIGILLRKAYREHNKEQLIKLKKQLKQVVKAFEEFYDAFKYQGEIERKPLAMDIYDLQMGGSITRVKACLKTLERYLNGDIDKIVELENELLPYNGIGISFLWWERMVSANFY